MKIKLKVFTVDYTDLGRRFRFAVLDLDRNRDYPANFVCILPTMVSNEGKVNNVFLKTFGDKSLEQAKLLLTEALKNEDEPEVKVEIERRLTLLEPKQASQIKCSGCGKLFQPRRIRRFKQNFCEECFKRKYRARQ
ncbi:MAG: hypothetical protein ABSB71_04430 [Candidatus Bathyarchaeia archaeon]|jgi:hypothetical protein